MARVRIERGGAWDRAVIENELGSPPLDILPVCWPVITVDGQVDSDATGWLAYVAARSGGPGIPKTATSYAESLAQFRAFLADRNTSLRGATRAHIVEYVRKRTVDDTTRVSGNTWARDRSAIKQFYEWLRETHCIEPPITIDRLHTSRGTLSSMREGRNVPKSSAAGTPLDPRQARILVSTAWEHGASGAANGTLTGSRDAAFIALGLACGARANTLTHLTIYELPDKGEPGDLVEMRLPGSTGKTQREVRLPAFRRHLAHVYNYATPDGGSRQMLIKDWRPDDPIHIAQPPTRNFHGITDSNGVKRPFNTMTADERRRLLTPEGQPAMLFLSARDGAPLRYATAKEITGDSSRVSEMHAINRGSFFPHVHTHDLRHTYATHLAALFFLGVPAGPGADMHGRPHRVDIRNAVLMASTGLGHVGPDTTALYIQQVGMMSLHHTVDDFLGKT
ncbi:site-specific integrase [Salinibacterium hongtaonis]|uniref:Core-binding (CB) domain-containing protein n=1 Tax=Homoserinimonas hongtaonis TaxID=2079791 RepID=A0A2U1T1S0_9MICO|nr:site-specific integrase [Salinibacterium hongtaonis]PWB97822.1 hypothetical protein DF220_08245 [Salinibacterium hongtaonis]